jgi:hypothetical protein
MLDATFVEVVTVRRPIGRDVKNETTYEEVLDQAGCPLPVKCRFERTRRRTVDLNGREKTADARMVYRIDRNTEIKPEYLIVTKREEVYSVIGHEDVGLMFGKTAQYGRLSLELTRQVVPKDKPV